MMDIIALAVGFGIGVVVVAIAIEFGTKKEKIIMPNTRRTIEWSINEIQNPRPNAVLQTSNIIRQTFNIPDINSHSYLLTMIAPIILNS